MSDSLTFDEIRDKVRFVVDKAHAQSVERELNAEPLHNLVAELIDSGIGALRVPTKFGGAGGTVAQLADLLLELAAAESNLPQIIRGHLGFIELLLQRLGDPIAEELLSRAGALEFFGPAASSPAAGSAAAARTQLPESHASVGESLLDGVWLHDDGAGLRLSGVKYYSTGSLFADWINVLVLTDEGPAEVVVPRHDERVTIVDDWNGFGQRFTASGTARFDAVSVPDGYVLAHNNAEVGEYLGAFYQFIHSATQAGIAQRAVQDIAEVVRNRRRAYPLAGDPTPAKDPQVLAVVGEVTSRAFAARAAVRSVAQSIDVYVNSAEPERRKLLDTALVDSAATQVHNSRIVGEVGWLIFDAASASALEVSRALDRHWRNARTISSHNPSIYKARFVGDYTVNGVVPQSDLGSITENAGNA